MLLGWVGGISRGPPGVRSFVFALLFCFLRFAWGFATAHLVRASWSWICSAQPSLAPFFAPFSFSFSFVCVCLAFALEHFLEHDNVWLEQVLLQVFVLVTSEFTQRLRLFVDCYYYSNIFSSYK